MNNGWIKLYRKSKDNPLMRDYKAWTVFSWILLTVAWETGEMTLGRFWASEYFKLNPSTFYKVLKRLQEKYKVVTLTSNNKFTSVRVLNWAKYQDRERTVTQDSNIKVTTKEQQSNTLQEVKNSRTQERRDTSPSFLLNIPSNDLAEFTLSFICTDRQVISKGQSLYDYCESNGKSYKDYKALLRNALRKDFGERIEVQPYMPDLPQGVSEEGLAKLREMKEKILGNKFTN